MEIIDIYPKDVHIKLDLSLEEIRGIHDFFEKSISLYAKVYSDGSIDESERLAERFNNLLEQIIKSAGE